MIKETLFNTKIEFIKGVGPIKASLLNKELSLFTYGDLIQYYPYRYEDRSKISKIKDIRLDSNIQVCGKITKTKKEGYKKNSRYIATLKDSSGVVDLIWFKGFSWIEKKLTLGVFYVVFGKISLYKNKICFTHPDISEENKKLYGYFKPKYSTTEVLKKSYINSVFIENIIKKTLRLTYNKIEETLPDEIISKENLLTKKKAVLSVHFPKDKEFISKAIYRLKFEELFYLQLKILSLKMKKKKKFEGYVFAKSLLLSDFYKKHIPFNLTGAQKRVVKECYKDMCSKKQMNRLIQGDVGSGKTVVAFLCMLLAVEGKTQIALMSPTEVLANQHFNSIKNYSIPLGIRVEILTGSTKIKDRKIIFQDLKNGKVDILIGTHALIEKKVVFKKLGLVVIDEQHKFGVAQRASLWSKKNRLFPHVLVMTATPIPRTLALTLYGDLDVSVIDELPKGRKKIKTFHRNENARLKVFGFINRTIKKGEQVYIVYPLIEESKTQDYKDLMDGYKSIKRAFPKTPISILHGRMKSENKSFEMKRFVGGNTKILISTTVIEVGVDVSKATVMVIENAERFGLAQLHQLRGRIGRGKEQSYCILMTKYELSSDAKKRIDALVKTSDGFKIADIDLQMRGPGNLMGTQQSGLLNLLIANLSEDGLLLLKVREIVIRLLEKDPRFLNQENQRILNQIKKFRSSELNWSRIS